MKLINVLHIASFNGNIGDNANHNGLRHILKDIFGEHITYDNLEMREFYQSWNLRDFNSVKFIELCNSYDLVIIGGGNFFELKWDYSSTGTTINLNKLTLEQISTPILFFGLGCDVGKGTNERNIEKFEAFLDIITNSNKYLVTVRNDGSLDTIKKFYGNQYENKIHKVFDGAFFMEKEKEKYFYPEIDEGNKYIGVNVVSDMKSIRFSNNITFNQFVENFADTLNIFLRDYNEYKIIFFPHIYSDLTAISELVERIDDKFRRTRVVVAPCLTGQGSERYIFGLYNHCETILGMRFHSNVCAIAQNIPTIALSSYRKINDLYLELNMSDRVIDVNKNGFEKKLLDKINMSLNNNGQIRDRYSNINESIKIKSKEFESVLVDWFAVNRIG